MSRFKQNHQLVLLLLAGLLLLAYQFGTISRAQKQIIVPPECQPFIQNPDQYTVTIDNQIYPQSIPAHHNRSLNFKCLNRDLARNKSVILLWNDLWPNPFIERNGTYSFEENGCPVTNCELTRDRARFKESSLVIVHSQVDLDQFPRHRPDSLRTVWLFYESIPTAMYVLGNWDFSPYNDFYNLTTTYRRDSDFAGFYEEEAGIVWKKNPGFDKDYDFHGEKRERGKFAVALISNCRDRSKRMELIDRLGAYVPVDVYGKCSGKKCPKAFANGTAGECRAILTAEYKFFLAFENSVCEDYITEKFFATIRHNIVPVVYGGGRYERYVRDFKVFLFI